MLVSLPNAGFSHYLDEQAAQFGIHRQMANATAQVVEYKTTYLKALGVAEMTPVIALMRC